MSVSFKDISTITLRKDGSEYSGVSTFSSTPNGLHDKYAIIPYLDNDGTWSVVVSQTTSTPATIDILTNTTKVVDGATYNGTSYTHTFADMDWLDEGSPNSLTIIIKVEGSGIDYDPTDYIYSRTMLVEYGPRLTVDVGTLAWTDAETVTHTIPTSSESVVYTVDANVTDNYFEKAVYNTTDYDETIDITVSSGNIYTIDVYIDRGWNGDGSTLVASIDVTVTT